MEARGIDRPIPSADGTVLASTLRAISLAVTLGFLSIPMVVVAETRRSPVHEAVIAVICALAALSGHLFSGWIEALRSGSIPDVVPGFMTTVGAFGLLGLWSYVAFGTFSSAGGVLLLSLASWGVATDFARRVRRMRIVRRDAPPPPDPLRAATQAFCMGYVLLFVFAAAAGAPTVLGRHEPIAGTTWTVSIVGYTLAGILTLSAVRYSVTAARWHLRGAVRETDMGVHWLTSLTLQLLLAAGACVLLWLAYTSGAIGILFSPIVPVLGTLGGALVDLLNGSAQNPTRVRPTPLPLPRRHRHSQGGGGGGTHTHAVASDLVLILQVAAILALIVAVVAFRYRAQLRAYLRTHSLLDIAYVLRTWFIRLLGVLREEAAHSLSMLQSHRHPALDAQTGERTGGWKGLVPGMASPRERVLQYYRSMVIRAGKQGMRRRKAQTPNEYAEVLAPALTGADEDVHALTSAYIEARYSRHEIDAPRAGTVRQVWHRVRAALRYARAEGSGSRRSLP